MKNTRVGAISILLLLFFLVPTLYADNGPEVYTRLLVDRDDDVNGRTPLILVHGIHGEEDANYWSVFRYFFYTSDLRKKFKVYQFIYDSDEISVDELANGFRFWIDEKTQYEKLPDAPYVILAHSMGGLVSRALLYKKLTNSNWAGKFAGDRCKRLITLATPHHGSPGASRCCRDLQVIDNDESWLGAIELIDLIYWTFKNDIVSPTSPNRSDLRWDNWDGTMTNYGYYSACSPTDNNIWLSNLNFDTAYDHKIIAYAGYVDPNAPERQLVALSGPAGVTSYLILNNNDKGKQAIGTSIVLKEGFEGRYGNNDGMVPYNSGMFEGHNAVQRRGPFIGFDHGQLKGDRLFENTDGKYEELFETLESDLEDCHIGIQQSPDKPRLFSPVTFFVNNDEDHQYVWEITDQDNSSVLLDGAQVEHVFKQGGVHTITLSVTGSGVTYSLDKQIDIGAPDIEVSYPNGFESLYREFSICESDYITEYEWNFGDGSPTETGREATHTYETSGYYAVTVTLILDDGSSISASEGIFVGPGTRYINGHTITGNETWHAGGTYHLLGNITVAQDGTLTIESGVTVKFQSNDVLRVYGTLDAEGVTFTWADGENQWAGIWFYDSGSSESRLDGCIIEHAYGCNGNYGVIYAQESSPTITGCTIRDSLAAIGIDIMSGSPLITGTTVSGMTDHGVYVRDSSSPTVTGCTLSENKYGIYVQYAANTPIFSGNAYTNNSVAGLYATGTITGAVSWAETGDSEYVLSSLNIAAGASLFIAPGRTVKFRGNGVLRVYGTLDAEGVTFTWADGENQWAGIWFYDSGSSESRLDGCIIEHAYGCNGNYGVIYAQVSSPTITGCTIRDSLAAIGIDIMSGSPLITGTTVSGMTDHGVYVRDSSSPTVTGCTLSENKYAIYIATTGDGTYRGNTIAGNSSYGIYKSGSNVVLATDNFWGDITGPLDDSDDQGSGGWYNPSGLGDRVSNFVEYYPWVGDLNDMDSDSLPDDWEWIIVDANPNDSIEQPLDVLPFDDFDGDGFSNIREFLSLSDPVLIQSIPVCWSDFSSDGDVDGMELNTLYLEIGTNDCSDTNPCSCDLNGDGAVDTLDTLFFSEDFGRTDCY